MEFCMEDIFLNFYKKFILKISCSFVYKTDVKYMRALFGNQIYNRKFANSFKERNV